MGHEDVTDPDGRYPVVPPAPPEAPHPAAGSAMGPAAPTPPYGAPPPPAAPAGSSASPTSYGPAPIPVWGGRQQPAAPPSAAPGPDTGQGGQAGQRWLTPVIIGGIVLGVAVLFILIRILLVGPSGTFDFSSGGDPTPATGSSADAGTGGYTDS